MQLYRLPLQQFDIDLSSLNLGSAAVVSVPGRYNPVRGLSGCENIIATPIQRKVKTNRQ